MKLQKDLFTPTSRLESVTLNQPISFAATEAVAAIYIYSDFIAVSKPKNGFVTMDNFLADLESDSEISEALPVGRKWIADAFYKNKNTLAKLRLEKGWSQKQLAEKLNTKQPYIARIENGIEDIQLSTIKKLAKIFDTGIIDIIEAINS